MSDHPRVLPAARVRAARATAASAGVREALPVAPGVFAWGLVTGVAMLQAGLTVPQSLGMTLITYAGSAQLAVLPLLAGAAPVWIVFATALVVNLRFVIYSLALRRVFAGAPLAVRVGLGYLTGDVSFVRIMVHLDRDPRFPEPLAYYAGSVACSWLAWQLGSVAGVLGARHIPASAGLELAGTLALVTLIVPLCTRRPALAGVLVAGFVSVAGAALPLKLGLIAAVVCGSVVAVALEGRLAAAAQRAGTA